MKQDFEKVWRSLDDMQRAGTSPFMLARIMHRIADRKDQAQHTGLRWGLVAAMVCLLVANTLTLLSSKEKTETNRARAVATEYAIQLANMY